MTSPKRPSLDYRLTLSYPICEIVAGLKKVGHLDKPSQNYRALINLWANQEVKVAFQDEEGYRDEQKIASSNRKYLTG